MSTKFSHRFKLSIKFSHMSKMSSFGCNAASDAARHAVGKVLEGLFRNLAPRVHQRVLELLDIFDSQAANTTVEKRPQTLDWGQVRRFRWPWQKCDVAFCEPRTSCGRCMGPRVVLLVKLIWIPKLKTKKIKRW